ncbi:ciliary neurotrophic factor [Xenopus laevis]|uniref:Ciliary neurotrophic factor n=2 Tax=Xenopus laevis TaxID=8355 RepID=A0A1L8FKN8_XENLA|nr:ciliary neurotrophic factor [Xenopus laevis]OCT72162.1 hypothetical protein XELAEV_18035131mg [Xenopus laevis]
MDSDTLFQDLCSRVIHQLGKLQEHLIPLTEKYLLLQGFDTLTLFEDPEDELFKDREEWAQMTKEERLQSNLNALLGLEKKLEKMVVQHSNQTSSRENGLFGGLQDVLAQVAALKSNMTRIGKIMRLSMDTASSTEDDISKGDVFDEKVEGYKVLKRLSFWVIRSLPDMRKLHGYNGAEKKTIS